MFVFAAVLLCSIIPSQVAFTSLISAGGVPTIAAYALIAALRLTCTPHAFKSSHFYLGRWARPMYLATVLFNGLVFAVRLFVPFVSFIHYILVSFRSNERRLGVVILL
jgi:translation initiation factor 5B